MLEGLWLGEAKSKGAMPCVCVCATLLYPQPRPCPCAALQHTQRGLGAPWDLGWREEGDWEQQSVIRRRYSSDLPAEGK